MYCHGTVSFKEVFSPLQTTAGEIIGEQYYYQLSASDIEGRQWGSKWILPNIRSGSELSGYIIDANIREITYISDLIKGTDTHYAGIYFPGKINVPCNTATKIEKMVKGEKRSTSIDLNISKFNSCGFDFEVEKESDWIVFNALSTTKTIDDATVMRFIEAFQFVLARSLSWSTVELIDGRRRKVRVRSCGGNDDKSRVGPPIRFQSVDNTNKVWLLFDRYLSHIIGYKDELWHPMFNWIHAVIESGSSSVDTEALVLSVAIESLLREEFEELEFNLDQLEAQVNKAKCIVAQSALHLDFKNRLQGSLGAMLKLRAKDILNILEEKGLVRPDLIKEYDKLRNSSTHGEVANVSKIQVYLDRCAAVLTLFYHLIFLTVGYTGPYTDYSTRGFHERRFDSSLPEPDGAADAEVGSHHK